MCGWTGHIQGNLALRVCEPLCGECAVQRQILSPGTAKLRRVQRTKQPKRSRGSGLPFASPLRRAQQKQGTATTRGKEFLSCAAGRNGSPLERGAFATRWGRELCRSRPLLWWFTLCAPAARRSPPPVLRPPALPSASAGKPACSAPRPRGKAPGRTRRPPDRTGRTRTSRR